MYNIAVTILSIISIFAMSTFYSQENQEKLESSQVNIQTNPGFSREAIDALRASEKWSFVKKYEREKHIAEDLNQIYYWWKTWGFRWWFNDFYDEWDVIFANSAWNAKIFERTWEELIPASGKYYEIQKQWNFYVWVRVDESKQGNLETLEASKKYTLFNKEWREIKNLRWPIYYQDWAYIETYMENDNAIHAVYDEDMNLLADKIPERVQLLAHKDGACLFSKEWDIFLTYQGKQWDGNYPSKEVLEQEEVFKQYQAKLEQANQDYKEKKEQNENMEILYTFDFDEHGRVKKITNKEWHDIFTAEDGYLYRMTYPHIINGKTPTELREKKDINTWLFVLQKFADWDRNAKSLESIFVNGNDGSTITSPATISWWFIVHGKVVSHYLNWDTAQLYNYKGEKLGIEAIHFMNNHDFQIFTNQNNKKQLVEQKTWIVHKQEFDTYLKTYKEGDRVVLIVENDGQIKEIALYE